MKTKIVYILISNNDDYYLERTLISVCSARLHNPDAKTIVVTDAPTMDTLKGKRAEIKKYRIDFVIVEIPIQFNKMGRSRYIKTNLRKIIQGDFLYIDCDTVICDNLAEIDVFDGDLGSVLSCNRPLPLGNSNHISDLHINLNAEKVKWPIVLGYPNYNGGVIFARDTVIAHQFYDRWFQLWQECAKQGVYIDMLALYHANIELNCCIKELSGIWNAQIQRQGLPFLYQAKIIHTYCEPFNTTLFELCSDRVLEKVKQQGFLDDEIIGLIKNSKTAFPHMTSLVKADEAAILNFPIVRLYYRNHTLFKIFNKTAYLYLKFVNYFTE